MKRLISFVVLVAFLSVVGLSSIGCGDDKSKKPADTKKPADETKKPPEGGTPPK
jgi:hypothetical protein